MRASHPSKKKAPQHASHPKKAATGKNKSQDPRHWILVTDHKKAHIYRKSPKGIERVPEEHLHTRLPLPREEASDEAFLQDLACWLDAAEKEDSFDRIAVIATPEALEALHGMVGEGVHCRICGTLERDVEKIAEDEIEDHLTEVVWL